ncbi:hypothetical protein XELAEV_18019707mg [Xenopus laevis]|uniref:Uncharacterized protein n=1 Tax=Xenopus laevis TaxID=8355 RepID=A0A974HQA9_XENLA|nr:hypothetical protein XELAEV_18019707mg [Xenopus laevis]
MIGALCTRGGANHYCSTNRSLNWFTGSCTVQSSVVNHSVTWNICTFFTFFVILCIFSSSANSNKSAFLIIYRVSPSLAFVIYTISSFFAFCFYWRSLKTACDQIPLEHSLLPSSSDHDNALKWLGSQMTDRE